MRGEHGDAAVPEVDEVVDGLPAGAVVVDGHRRERLARAADRHHVHAHHPQPLLLGLVDHEPDHHGRVHPPPGGQVLEEGPAVVGVGDEEEQQVDVGAAQARLEALEHRAEEPARQVRHHHGDPGPGGAAREAGGLGGRHVVEVGGGREHAVAGGGRHLRVVAQGARGRRRGDPGEARDVVEAGPSPGAAPRRLSRRAVNHVTHYRALRKRFHQLYDVRTRAVVLRVPSVTDEANRAQCTLDF